MDSIDPYRAPQSSVTPSEPTGGGAFYFQVDPHRLTKVVLVFLGIGIAFDVLSLLGDGLQYMLALRGTFTEAEGAANDARQRIIGLSQMAIYFATTIPFAMWIYRANLNSHGFGATNIADSPGWSVGWYFIPIASLFKPYQGMKQIWQVSRDPRDWPLQDTSGVLPIWWTLWLTSNVIGRVMWSYTIESIDDLKTFTIISVAANLVSIALALMAMKLIKMIIANQDRLVGGNVGITLPPGTPRLREAAPLMEEAIDEADPY